ncbi:MAG: Sec-independent protein translocase protein TatB [Piscinibacter sp.]
MIDFGFDKIALIGAVALIVIGPERLPRVARTVGHLLGKAQRYVADVKAEVNRSIELDELAEDEEHVRGRGARRRAGLPATRSARPRRNSTSPGRRWSRRPCDVARRRSARHAGAREQPEQELARRRSAAMPQWYKQRHGVRGKAQSGARVARFRAAAAAGLDR